MSVNSLVEELREFNTALLANTIGYIDPTPPHEYYMGRSIHSVTPSLGPTVGVAYTCELDTSTPADEQELETDERQLDDYYRFLDELATSGEPAVWVVKAVGSRPEHECVLGDGMAKALYSAGCIGVVTDGGVRDVKGLLSVPFAAYCRGLTVHHCPFRFKRFNSPVEVGGITVRPGDLIHADSEGVIKIPRRALDRLPERATQMQAFEHDAHRILRQTGIQARVKHELVAALLVKYGFGKSHALDASGAPGTD